MKFGVSVHLHLYIKNYSKFFSQLGNTGRLRTVIATVQNNRKFKTHLDRFNLNYRYITI